MALVLVLWAVAVLSGIALHIGASARGDLAVARNVSAAARAELVAQAAVAWAVHAMLTPGGLTPGGAGSNQADGAPRRVALPDGSAEVSVEDERGKVNPLLSPPEMMAALLRAVGQPPAMAAAIAEAVADAHLRAPPDSRPPVRELEDLLFLPMMTPDLLERLRPGLTLVSPSHLPDPQRVGPLVRRALQLAGTDPGLARVAAIDGTLADERSRPPIAFGDLLLLRVAAEGRDGGRFTAEAVVELDAYAPAGHRILSWARVVPRG